MEVGSSLQHQRRASRYAVVFIANNSVVSLMDCAPFDDPLLPRLLKYTEIPFAEVERALENAAKEMPVERLYSTEDRLTSRLATIQAVTERLLQQLANAMHAELYPQAELNLRHASPGGKDK